MKIEIGGMPVHVEQYGQGKDLLLLHGWGGRIESWLPVIRDFSARFRLTVLDFPGHGETPEPPEPWSVTEYMEQTAELMRQMGIERADIIAHSFGGRVSLLLASSHPERVGKMVLTGCAGLIPERGKEQKARMNAYKRLRALFDNGLTRKVLGAERVGALRDALQKKFGSADYAALTPSMRATFSRVVNQDLRPCLPGIKASTLLIWGEEDTLTPLWMGEVMEKEIPDAGLVRLSGCGHFAYLERYQDFRAIAEKFLV